jgi:glycosyltransferase involved in cell wall biosynthesis
MVYDDAGDFDTEFRRYAVFFDRFMGEVAMNLDDVTIIVPTKNEHENVVPFLRSIPPRMRLIVVDASDDDTRDVIRRTRPVNTGIIRDPGNIACARQRGADAATTEWLLYTDADVVFDDTYFERLARIEPGGRCGGIIGAKTSRARYRMYYRLFNLWLRLICFLNIPAGTGSNMIVRRRALQEAGGFDLNLSCNEDSLLTWRVGRCGYRVPYHGELAVYETDHRRLERGLIRKSLHSIVRCIMLFAGAFGNHLRDHDWGYWSGGKCRSPERGGEK